MTVSEPRLSLSTAVPEDGPNTSPAATSPVFVRLPAALVAELHLQAEHDGRTITATVRRALAAYLGEVAK